MRRGFLRLRSRFAPRRGLIQLGYLRELGFVTLLMSGVLFVQQALRTPAAPTVDNPHADQPVYGLTLCASDQTLWVSRERYGISHINLADGTETDRWLLFQSEASFAAHGGNQQTLTLRYGLDRRLDLLRGSETIHSEVLPEAFGIMTDTDVSSDGRVGVVVSNGGDMKIWALKDPDGLIVEAKQFPVPDQLDHAALSPDGKTIALVNWQSVFLWSLDENRIVTSWKVSHGAKPAARANRADTLAWSPDGQRFAIGFDDGMVRVWDTANQNLLWEHQADQFKVGALAFTSSGTSLVTGGFDKHIRLWDLNRKQLVWEQVQYSRPIHNLIFSADDRRLYSGGLDGKVCEWSASTGALVRELP